MRANDQVLSMGSGRAAYLERQKDDSYAKDDLSYPLIYGPDVTVGTDYNSNLPVLTSDQLGYYNLDEASPGSSCASGFAGKQCTGTALRRIGATFANDERSPWDIMNTLRPDKEYMESWLTDPKIQQLIEEDNASLTGNKIPKVPEKDSSIEDKLETYMTRFGAWHLKDIVEQNGGKVLWSRNDINNNEFDLDSIKDVGGNLKVGDIITLARKDGTADYNQYKIYGYNNEDNVTHVGIVVGQTEDGTPVIEHSWDANGIHKTKREPINQMSLHIPSSILRAPALIEDLQQDTESKSGNPDPSDLELDEEEAIASEDNALTKRLNAIRLPAKFDSIKSFHSYMNVLDPEVKSRLKNASVYTSKGGNKYAMYELPTDHLLYGSNFLSDKSTIWAPTAEEVISKKSDREARRIKKDTPKVRHGGLIYKK